MNLLPDIYGPGQLLAFSGIDGKTDFTNAMCLRTEFSGKYRIEFKKRGIGYFDLPGFAYVGNEPDKVEITGDFIKFYAGSRCSKLVLVDSWHVLLEGEFRFDAELQWVEAISKGSKTLAAIKGFLNPALLELDIDTEIAKRAEFLLNIKTAAKDEIAKKAEMKALSQLKTQIYAPEAHITHFWSTPDRWPHQQMWLWDSVFHAIGMRHYRPALARHMISAMFDLQQENGFIPICGSVNNSHHNTQPPVLGLGMTLVNESEAAPEWIAELAPKLERYIEWIFANRDTDGAGLVEWKIDAYENCRSGESGMDNSPRFDGAIQLDAPDFNAFLAYECEALARFLPEKKAYWMAHYHRLCKLMNERLWSPELNLYVDYDVVANQRTDIMSSAGFLPLYCGAATPEMAAKMAEHLTDPETFGTPFRVPSIAACNTAAYKKDMWRGPVWININTLIAFGLERYGFHALARSIMQDTKAELEKYYLQCGTFFEFYDDRKEVDPRKLERKGLPPDGLDYHPFHQSFNDYGWTATLYLNLLNTPAWV